MTLSGVNTYSGVTTVSAGTLQAGSVTALSAMSDFTVATGATLNLSGFSNSLGSLAGSGTVTNTGAAATLSAGGDNLSTTFSGTLQNGSGALGLSKLGTGTLTLSGANTYSGATSVSAGTLQAGSTTALSATSAFTVNSILDLNGFSNSVGSLAGTAIVTNNGIAVATLTAGGDNTSTTFSGVLQNGIGTLGLIKSGTGTLILTGTSTYSGLTDVQAGVLSVRGTLTNSAVQVENGATLGGAGTINGAVTILSGGILSPGNNGPGTLTVGSLVLNSGSVSSFELSTAGVIGSGVNDLVAVTGNLTLAGSLNITDLGGFGTGVYRLFNYGGVFTDNGMTLGTLPGGVSAGALTIQTSVANQVNLVVSGTSLLQFWDGTDAPNNGVVGGGNGTWNTANTNWTVADGSTNSAWKQGFAVFEATAGTVTLAQNETMAGLEFVSTGYLITSSNGSTITAAAGTILEAGTGVSGTIGVGIVGAGDVTVTNLGTVILTAANTYTGGTTISGGTLQIGNGGTTGSVVGAIVNNSALVLNRSDDLFFANPISGTGSFEKMGADQVTITGTNTYTGGTIIDAGTLVIGDGTTNGSITGPVANSGALSFNRSDAISFGGVISGSGSLTQAGSGTLRLSAINTYTGITNISAGTLQLGNNDTTGGIAAASNISIGTNGTLNFDWSNAQTVANLISGTGNLKQSGASVLALTGVNTFSGTTTIIAGGNDPVGQRGNHRTLGRTITDNGSLILEPVR